MRGSKNTHKMRLKIFDEYFKSFLSKFVGVMAAFPMIREATVVIFEETGGRLLPKLM